MKWSASSVVTVTLSGRPLCLRVLRSHGSAWQKHRAAPHGLSYGSTLPSERLSACTLRVKEVWFVLEGFNEHLIPSTWSLFTQMRRNTSFPWGGGKGRAGMSLWCSYHFQFCPLFMNVTKYSTFTQEIFKCKLKVLFCTSNVCYFILRLINCEKWLLLWFKLQQYCV